MDRIDPDLDTTDERTKSLRNFVIAGIVILIGITVPYLMYANISAQRHERTMRTIEAERRATLGVPPGVDEKTWLAEQEAKRRETEESAEKVAAAKAREARQARSAEQEAAFQASAQSAFDAQSGRMTQEVKREQAGLTRAERTAAQDRFVHDLRNERQEQLKQQEQERQVEARLQAQRDELRRICLERYGKPDC